MRLLNNTYSPKRLLPLALLLALAGGGTATADFDVLRATDASQVSGAAAHASVGTSPFDDDSMSLLDGLSYYYLVRESTGQPVLISVHKEPTTQAVRLSFDDGDPTSAPVDPETSTLTTTPATILADGLARSHVEVVPRDSFGVPLGRGLALSLNLDALGPGLSSGAFVDHADGSYSLDVTSDQPGFGLIDVTVEGLDLNLTPTLTYRAVFDAKFQVNTISTGKQEKPVVAQAGDGSVVIVWQGEDGDDKGIIARIFDADGSPVGGEFVVNSSTAGKQESPALAVAADGTFVVIWQAPDSDDKGVFGQLFAADGQPIGVEFQVHEDETGKQDKPQLAMGDDGAFAVLWQGPDADDKGIFIRFFDATGQPQDDELVVNTNEAGKQDHPHLALAGDGRAVVVWQGADSDDKGVFGRRFDDDGSAVGAEFLVNSVESGKQQRPRVALADNSFTVVWESDDANDTGVFARPFDTMGVPQGVESQVNSSSTGKQKHPDVAMAPDGSSIVVWKSDDGDKHIMAQRFDADGNLLEGELQLTDETAVNPDKPNASLAADLSSYIVVWQDDDDDQKGVFGRWVPVD